MKSIPLSQIGTLFRPLALDLIALGVTAGEVQQALENGETRERLRSIIVGTKQPTIPMESSEIFPLKVEQRTPLEEQMRSLGFGNYTKHFRDSVEMGPRQGIYQLISFGRILGPESAAELIRAKRLHPTTILELLAFIRSPPLFYQRAERVVAAGALADDSLCRKPRVATFHGKPTRTQYSAYFVGGPERWLEPMNKLSAQSKYLVRLPKP